MVKNSELLLGLSADELEALADSLLTPVAQARLDDLIARRKEKRISSAEEIELDRMLQKIDQLTSYFIRQCRRRDGKPALPFLGPPGDP